MIMPPNPPRDCKLRCRVTPMGVAVGRTGQVGVCGRSRVAPGNALNRTRRILELFVQASVPAGHLA